MTRYFRPRSSLYAGDDTVPSFPGLVRLFINQAGFLLFKRAKSRMHRNNLHFSIGLCAVGPWSPPRWGPCGAASQAAGLRAPSAGPRPLQAPCFPGRAACPRAPCACLPALAVYATDEKPFPPNTKIPLE